jgi:hypothetical protein
MNKLVLIILFGVLLQSYKSKGQITLEHILDSTAVPYFYYTNIGNNDFKYVFLNQVSNSFSLYNMDMSPYLLNINIPAVGDSIADGFGVIYITKSLFDCDSTNIEYVYENPYDTDHAFRVYRTDGTLLFQVDSANGPYYLGGGIYGGSNDFRPIANTSSGTKLFLQKYDSNNVPEILIYSLCGNLENVNFDFTNQSFVRIFPNPATMELNFEIVRPNNQEQFYLSIFDTNAGEQKKENILLNGNKYTIDIRDYSNGIYYYSLSTKSRIYQTGKFIITK